MSGIIESISNLGGVGKGFIQSKGSSNVLLPEMAPAQIEDAEWIISVMADAERDIGAIESKRRQIQKVTPELRNIKENEGVYDPKIVSIGPYHHGKPELKEGEKLKAAMAFLFIRDSQHEAEEFYKKTLELVGEARDCYLEGSPFVDDDKAFARMMFLDGCFLLGYIEAKVSNMSAGRSFWFSIMGQGRMYNLMLDIILLENQLPFLVIWALMSIRYNKGEGERVIHEFLRRVARKTANNNQVSQDLEQRQPLHLLELLRERYLSHHHKAGGERNRNTVLSSPPKGIDHSFGSAIELKAKGIHFKSSGITCLTDISFTSSCGYGQLTLPPIISSDKNKALFLNMMAYELAPNTSTGCEVCSYIYFMNSLISGADDVIELRSHNIIYNFLDSNEGVAKFFNTLASAALFPNFDIIEDVCDQIEKHYTSKTKTWVAQFLHDHFSTPWASLAFFAALLVIFLTFTQTYFQVFPRSTNQK